LKSNPARTLEKANLSNKKLWVPPINHVGEEEEKRIKDVGDIVLLYVEYVVYEKVY
jgi:hypothetical protein